MCMSSEEMQLAEAQCRKFQIQYRNKGKQCPFCCIGAVNPESCQLQPRHFETGHMLMEGDLKNGDVVQGFIQIEIRDGKGKTLTPGGFVCSDTGRIFVVWTGELEPFFSKAKALERAEECCT